MRQVHVDGHAIDAGPTVFTLKRIFEQLFDNAGLNFDTYVPTQKAERLARHLWQAGEQMDLFASVDQSTDAIGDFAGASDAKGFQRFIAKAGHIFRTLDDSFMRRPAPSFWGLLTRAPFLDLLRASPSGSLWSALGNYFQDPRLVQLFGRYATYTGSSPFQAPNTLMLIAFAEQEGVWMVDGGMHLLARGLEKACRDKGVDFRYDCPVSAIGCTHGQVSTVTLHDGEQLPADNIIFNGDIAAIAQGHLGDDVQRAVPALRPAARSLSALTWCMLAKPTGVELHRHTVFFGNGYKKEFDALFKDRRMPPDPTTYICAQDRHDDCQGPDGEERLLCLINAPPIGDRKDFDGETVAQWQHHMLDRLHQGGLTLHADQGRCEATSPTDFARLFPATGGALYGRASHGWRASFQRPGVRTKLPGLYLAGGSAHPSAGVPMAALSGWMAARCLLLD